MTPLRTPLALTLATALLLGACDGQVTSYTESEAPKNLALDTSTTHVDVRFAPGSAKLTSADTAQLNRLAATGAIGPADRVTVAATGGPSLAEQRVASVAALLLHYGIVVAAEYREAIEAIIEAFMDEKAQIEEEARMLASLKMWKRLLVGLRIKERLDTYEVVGGDGGDEENQEELQNMQDDNDDDGMESEEYVDDGAGGFFLE